MKLDPNDLNDQQMNAILEADDKTDVPCDPDAERAVLACALEHPDAGDTVVASLQEQDFHVGQHRVLFGIVARLLGSEFGGIDEVSVLSEAHRLRVKDNLPDLGKLRAGRHNPARVREYIKRLIDASVRRSLIQVAASMRDRIARGVGATDALGGALTAMEDLHNRQLGVTEQPEDLRELALKISKTARSEPACKTWGLPTGVADGALDEITGGLVPGTHWIVTGLTKNGKSWLSMLMALGCRRLNPDKGQPLIVSTELTKEANSGRVLAVTAGVPVKTLLRRNPDSHQEQRMLRAETDTSILPEGVKAVYMGGQHINAVLAVARQHKRQHGLPLLVIDLASGLTAGHGDDERRDLEAISAAIQRGCKKLDTTIVAVVQQKLAAYNEPEQTHETLKRHVKGTLQWIADSDVLLGVVRGDSGSARIFMPHHRQTGEQAVLHVNWNPERGDYVLAKGENDG